MATRSNVIVKVKKEDIGRVLTHEFKGKTYETKIEKPYIGIYCHWDGYTDGVGKELVENYNDYEKALQLISGGYTSSIDGDDVNYYMGWDREELWTDNHPRQTEKTEITAAWTEYAYIFDNGKWYVGIVNWDKDDNEAIEDVVELTEDVIKNGHPKQRD